MAGDEFKKDLDEVLGDLRQMLVAKNEAYGDSALAPLRVFSAADPVEQLKVRLDDKLSRLARGKAAGEDVETDLLGYLVLLRIARMRTPADKCTSTDESSAGRVVDDRRRQPAPSRSGSRPADVRQGAAE